MNLNIEENITFILTKLQHLEDKINEKHNDNVSPIFLYLTTESATSFRGDKNRPLTIVYRLYINVYGDSGETITLLATAEKKDKNKDIEIYTTNIPHYMALYNDSLTEILHIYKAIMQGKTLIDL